MPTYYGQAIDHSCQITPRHRQSRHNSISTARSCGVTWSLRSNLARRFRSNPLIQNVFHVIGSSPQLNKKTTNPAKRPNSEQHVQCFSLAEFCTIGTLTSIPRPTRTPPQSHCLPPNGEWLLTEDFLYYCFWPIAAPMEVRLVAYEVTRMQLLKISIKTNTYMNFLCACEAPAPPVSLSP